jgi:hypothetical protein
MLRSETMVKRFRVLSCQQKETTNNGSSPFDLMTKHTQIVAALHIALGALSLLGAIVVFVVFGMAGSIVISQGQHQAAGILGIIAVALDIFLGALGLPGIIGGWALLSGRSWGRPLVLVLGALHLINIPLGTALGIYTIWALVREPVPRLPGASTTQPIA